MILRIPCVLTAQSIATTSLAFLILSSCSPYVYSSDVQTLSTKMASIDTSYQDGGQQIIAEKHLSNRLQWIQRKPLLAAGPGCNAQTRTNSAVPCDLIEKGAAVNTVGTVVDPPQPVPPAVDACETATDLSSKPTAIGTAKTAPPLQRADLPKAFDNYTAALAAVTKAQDRADFDAAAAKVSAAVGALAGPYATAAKASSNAALWLVGQELDYRRLEELKIATGLACEPIHILAPALGVVLDEQRGDRLDVLHTVLEERIRAVNVARTTPHITDQAYGAAIDDAQAAADAFQAVYATNPEATAQALSNAHDALVVAVRNNDGQFAALVVSLQTLSQEANTQAAGAVATPSPTTSSAVKKS
jgi:hypothetical protein